MDLHAEDSCNSSLNRPIQYYASFVFGNGMWKNHLRLFFQICDKLQDCQYFYGICLRFLHPIWNAGRTTPYSGTMTHKHLCTGPQDLSIIPSAKTYLSHYRKIPLLILPMRIYFFFLNPQLYSPYTIRFTHPLAYTVTNLAFTFLAIVHYSC